MTMAMEMLDLERSHDEQGKREDHQAALALQARGIEGIRQVTIDAAAGIRQVTIDAAAILQNGQNVGGANAQARMALMTAAIQAPNSNL